MNKNNNNSNCTPWQLIPSWLDKSQSDYWMFKIHNSVNWYRPIVSLYGKKHIVPRMSFFLAESGITYKYSGTKHFGEGWPEWFCPLLEKVRSRSNVQFNGCLLNLYRDGSDSMGWHSDNESELDSTKSIASLSLGGSRNFFIRSKNKSYKEDILLNKGDLLVMFPDCQIHWEHSLPLRKRSKEPRINLTFRRYLH